MGVFNNTFGNTLATQGALVNFWADPLYWTNPLVANPVQVEVTTTKYDAFGIMNQYPNGKMFYITRRGNTHVAIGDYGVIIYSESGDGGATWSEPIVIKSEANVDLRNIGGGVIDESGRVILFYARFNPDTSVFLSIEYIILTKELTSISAPVSIPTTGMSLFSPHGQMIKIGDGKYFQCIYGNDGTNYYVKGITSTDGGLTWSAPFTILSSTTHWSESSFVYLENNCIIGISRNDIQKYFHQVKSEDNGATWTAQGNVTFQGGLIAEPCTLSRFYHPTTAELIIEANYLEGPPMPGKVNSVFGKPDDLLAGVSGWDQYTRINDIVPMYYTSVLHPKNERLAIVNGTRDVIPDVAKIVFARYGMKILDTDLISDPELDTPAYWETTADVTVTGGAAVFVNAIDNRAVKKTNLPGIVVGSKYRVSFKIEERTTGGVYVWLRGNYGDPASLNGYYNFDVICGNSSTYVGLLASGTTNLKITHYSIKKILTE